MAKSVAVALVSSRLDYANSLLYGTSQSNIIKLQRIQNCLAKLTLRKYSIASSAALQTLHWLPIKRRIEFKLCLLTYKITHTNAPSYLAPLIHPQVASRALRSANQEFIHKPFSSTAIGSRAFRVAAPTVWNKIPVNIRLSQSLMSFRHLLKTHLFTVSD